MDVTPTSDDDVGSYLSLFNVDEAYANDYIFQVLVTKPSDVVHDPGCEPFNSTDGALVGQLASSNVSGRNISGRNITGRNITGRNPVPVDGDLDAQTIQNTSFTMGSSTADYLALGQRHRFADQLRLLLAGVGRIGECTQAAPRLPNTVTITLRAYQITASPDPRVSTRRPRRPPSRWLSTPARPPTVSSTSGPDLAYRCPRRPGDERVARPTCRPARW